MSGIKRGLMRAVEDRDGGGQQGELWIHSLSETITCDENKTSNASVSTRLSRGLVPPSV